MLSFLSPGPGGLYVDCTVGGGGHALKILEASSPDGRLIGIDKDIEALNESGRNLERFGSRVLLVQGDFKALKEILLQHDVRGKIDGILLDLGVSSHQLDTGRRGFSFLTEGPLDMRMNQRAGETASELLDRLSEKELAFLLKKYGEERWAGPIARAIKQSGTVKMTSELVGIVEAAVPKKFHPKRIHVATRVFQALRIAVNEELKGLDDFIEEAVGLLKKGGRMAVISFHSLEDRIVKKAFRELARGCICPSYLPLCVCGRKEVVRLITKKVVIPSDEEVKRNPRSRSAKLRVAEKL